jgi:hypothetical protein
MQSNRDRVWRCYALFRVNLQVLRAWLPRLCASGGAGGSAVNLAAVLLMGLLGAVLVHLAAYHVHLDSTGLYLLQHCPWRPVLLSSLFLALGTTVIFWRSLRVLRREQRLLARRIGRPIRGAATVVLPRRWARLVVFFLILYVIIAIATATAMRIVPMQAPMFMGGHLMLMDMAPSFPLPLGQAVLALAAAVVLWRCERRIVILREIVAVLRRLLAAFATVMPAARPLADAVNRPLRLLLGVQIYSRPPPAEGQRIGVGSVI